MGEVKRQEFPEFHGITFDSSSKKWRAYIGAPHRPGNITLGGFLTAPNAAMAWDRAALLLGRYDTNHPQDEVEKSVWAMMLPEEGTASIKGRLDGTHDVTCECGCTFHAPRKGTVFNYWRCEGCGRRVYYDGSAKPEEELMAIFNPKVFKSTLAEAKASPEPKTEVSTPIPDVAGQKKYHGYKGVNRAPNERGEYAVHIIITHLDDLGLSTDNFTLYLGAAKDAKTGRLWYDVMLAKYFGRLRKRPFRYDHSKKEIEDHHKLLLSLEGKKAKITKTRKGTTIDCPCGYKSERSATSGRGRSYTHCSGCGALIDEVNGVIDPEGWYEKLPTWAMEFTTRLTKKPAKFCTIRRWSKRRPNALMTLEEKPATRKPVKVEAVQPSLLATKKPEAPAEPAPASPNGTLSRQEVSAWLVDYSKKYASELSQEAYMDLLVQIAHVSEKSVRV